jgi:hypothetical protein
VKYALYPALVAICTLAAFAPVAKAADGCAAYGDEKTDFTWRLCPAGEKYERRYLYFGVWSKFYRVNGDSGACSWSVTKSSWVCPDRTIRCDPRRCGRS